MRKRIGLAVMLAALASLVLPGTALAQLAELETTVADKSLELDMVWVAVATALVFLMQAGFMFLEIGFSRQKNAGTGVAKILVNLAIVTLAWWAIGYGVAEGGGNDFFGTSGFFFHFDQTIGQGEEAFNVAGSDAMLMLFGLAFCAVSLAIVWGTTLERIKFGAYVIYAVDLRRGDLPAGRARGLGRRPAFRHRRQAGDGLRRLLGRPPHRRDRRSGGAAAARRPQGQIRRPMASRGRSPGTRCRWSASA